MSKFAKTNEIRAALQGRETEVLDALGIQWRKGRPHIDCPYPSHGGAADWRWDHKANKARCTCTPGDSIFDIVMRCDGCDFEAAKLRVAELLGRRDLIHEKSEKRRSQGQATDAASLLNSPPDVRDDALVRAYLGHRLGIPADEVPLPSTPVVGWSSLPYFDPPETGDTGAKPTLVGRFPCAVFGTVGADGGRHAHRIYIAVGGAGKADLGSGPNGRPRDPKKSARTLDTAVRFRSWSIGGRADLDLGTPVLAGRAGGSGGVCA